jgi:hypothetical protein
VPSTEELTRDEKVENLITNFSMIMMGIFEGVFTSMAAGLADAMSKTADAIAEGLGGEKGPGEQADMGAEVSKNMGDVFSKLRAEVSSGVKGRESEFREFIRDPSFDEGVRIAEAHDLGLPVLTRGLTDADLAGYVRLIQDEDPKMGALMKELGEWQKTTPRFDRTEAA